MLESLKSKVDESDPNFLRSIVRFANCAKNMPKSRLSSFFHNFGAVGVFRTRLTATSVVRKAKRGKIYVQPDSVKRRKLNDGSKRKKAQGQNARSKPFKPATGKAKQSNRFAENVRRNEKVAKKAGRTMATNTRI